jgi:hypothetical protein
MSGRPFPSLARTAALAPIVFVVGTLLNLVFSDDSVGTVLLRGLFVAVVWVLLMWTVSIVSRRSRPS